MRSAQDLANKVGMAFAHCGDIVFQVVKCGNKGCSGNVVYRCKADEPAIDMRKLILVPEPAPFIKDYEQCLMIMNMANWHDYLKFDFIPCWDESHVSQEQFVDHFKKDLDHLKFMSELGVPLFMAENEFFDRLNQETATGKIKLRRLLPDTPKFRCLLNSIAPNKIWELFDEDGVSGFNADGNANHDLSIAVDAWKQLIEQAAGQTIEDAISHKLTAKGIASPSPSELRNIVVSKLHYKVSPSREQLWDIVSDTGFHGKLDSFFIKVFRSILYPICTKLALEGKRKELLDWPNQVEPGKALFVDAPMGLGKTYSIVEALASNPDLSAVIFMPTNKLCKEIIENLKVKIAVEKKLDYWEIQSHRIPIKDDGGKDVFDEDGLPEREFDRKFIEDEVYYADGINPKECPHFEQFIKRYKYGLFGKSDICDGCAKFLDTENNRIACRFRRHSQDAPHSRIVVTTHHQYGNYFRQPTIRKWYKSKDEKIDRNFFIVDEDIVFSQCYVPICLNSDELKSFVSVITDFMAVPENLNGHPVPETAINKIDRILAQFEKCDTSSVVPAIDPDFELPQPIKDAWNDVFNKQAVTVPETLNWSEPVGNHIEIVEKAIRKGFVVQNYKPQFQNNGKSEVRKVKKAYLSNPISYDLSELPPHVFFDGTMLPEEFLTAKLQNVDPKKLELKIDTIWEIDVKQNIWSDLPKSTLDEDKSAVQQFICDLIREKGGDAKYFLVTKKDIREKYLEKFLKLNFPDLNIVVNHYRNLRGENKAKDCDIGIMLGSYAPPDAVEIAMALDFIQDKLSPNRIIASKNKLWSFNKTNFRRVYKDEFSIVGEIADANRQAEHRQAIARTRYLFHDVNFYVLSKDLVEDYEPYLPKAVTHNYRSDLFFKLRRSDSDYPNTVKAVAEWLTSRRKVTRKNIADVRNIRAGTIGNHLKEMVERGLLDKPQGHSYYLSPNQIIVNGEFRRKT